VWHHPSDDNKSEEARVKEDVWDLRVITGKSAELELGQVYP
jgi:hypothetical protein